MPLGPYMLGCAVILVGEAHDQNTDSYKRGPIGTEFFVRVESETVPDAYYGYLITCEHLIEDQNHVQMQIPTAEDPTKGHPLIEAPDFEHPVARLDLAIAESRPPKDYILTGLQGLQTFSRVLTRGLCWRTRFTTSAAWSCSSS